MTGFVKKGDTVYLQSPGNTHLARRGGHIKEGTEGEVVAIRKLAPMDRQFLVKFVGHSTPRHCEGFQLKEKH